MELQRFLLLVPVAIVGCGPTPIPELPTPGFVQTGYVCSASPSEAYSPGYLYRVDERGAELLVRDLRSVAETSTYRAALGTHNASVTRGAGISFQLLQPLGSVGGSANASGSSTQITKVSFSDGRYVLMTDDDANAIVKAATQHFETQSGSRYYIVRDAIQAKGVDIALSAQDESKLGGEVKIGELATATPNVSVTRKEDLTVSGTFEQPLNVCIRPMAVEPVIAEPGALGPVSDEVQWQPVARYGNTSDALRILNTFQ